MKPKVFYSLPCPACEVSTEPTDVQHHAQGGYIASFRCTNDECEDVVWTHRFPYSYDQLELEHGQEDPEEPEKLEAFEGDPLKWKPEDVEKYIEVDGRSDYLQKVENWRRQSMQKSAAE